MSAPKAADPLVGSPPIPKSEMDARLATRDLPPAVWIDRAIAVSDVSILGTH